MKLIIANWKMYPTLADSLVLTSALRSLLPDVKGVEIVLAPPQAWLVSVVEEWRHRVPHISFAAQNVWPEDQGAFTGEASAYLLKNLIKYALVGHSERRHLQQEPNDLVNEKLVSCLRWQVRPILCVGEDKKVFRSNGEIDKRQMDELENQLSDGLYGVKEEDMERVVIAYEPVWAIGTSNPATGEYAAQVITALRNQIAKKYSRAVADGVKILYGGSVAPGNTRQFLQQDGIDGLLVGSVSVKAKEFTEICRIAAEYR